MAIEQQNTSSNQISSTGGAMAPQGALAFTTADIKGMALGDHNSLVVTLNDGRTFTIGNFQALAEGNTKLMLQDGQTLDAKQLLETLSENAPVVHIAEPAAGQTQTYIINGGQKYSLDFDMKQPGMVVTHKDGQIIITFSDHSEIKLMTDSHPNDPLQPQISVNGQAFVSLDTFEHTLHFASGNGQGNDTDLADAAQKLAGIDPAAGGNGVASNHGYGFNSSIEAAPLNSENPLGPIGRTELAYGLPTYETASDLGHNGTPPSSISITINNNPPTTPTGSGSNLGASVPDVVVKEDHSITIPVTAALHNPNSSTEALTVTLTGIPGANVGTFSSPIGTYDAAHGTWTVTLAPGQDLNTTFTFTPFHNSDVDFGNLHLTASANDANGTITTGADFYVTVDAVADTPIITAHGAENLENTILPVTIAGALTDTDGSETITGYKISGVPDGFSFNHGVNLGNGVWSFAPGDIAGLTATSPHNFVGTLNLTATILNAETNLSGKEVDYTDNTNSASTPLTLIWDPIHNTPTITINGVSGNVPDQVVKENSSITIPLVATLGGNDTAHETLTVTITGIPGPNVGTFSAPGGVYDAAHGTYTITLAPGQNLSEGLTFTPFKYSDVDFGQMHATVSSYDSSTGETATATTDFYVTTDAVAEVPGLTTQNVGEEAGHTSALAITTTEIDPDGSEVISGLKISGLPAGATLNHGTLNADGSYTLTQADLTGLTITTTKATAPGSYTLTVQSTSTETNLHGKEVDFTDNSATATQHLTLTVTPNSIPVITSTGLTPGGDLVYEHNLTPTTMVSDHVTATYGVDGPGAIVGNNTFTSSTTLTSGGQVVTVTQTELVTHSDPIPVGGTASAPTIETFYTGTTANGHTVFTLDVHQDGTYTFTLDAPLDHAHGNTPNDAITLNFGITATDSDGDTATNAISINVIDDHPVAHDDVNNFYTSAGHTTGNVITGLGDTNTGGADTLSHDGNNHVTEIDYGTTHLAVVSGTASVIDGQYGELKISADGSYTYTLFQTTTTTSEHFTGGDFGTVQEGVAVNPATTTFGEIHSNLVVAGQTAVTGTIDASTSANHNTLVGFTIGADGTLEAAKILANDTNNDAGAKFSYTPAGNGELGFSIVANGATLNHNYANLDLTHGNLNFVYDYGQADQRTANIHDSGSAVSLVYTDATGHNTVLQGAVYFTSDAGTGAGLNSDGVIHSVSGTNDTGTVERIGFEDTKGGGDKDYNDTVFDLNIQNTTTTTTPGSDHFVYTVTDNDGSTSQATLTFNGEAPPSITTTIGGNPPTTSGPPGSAVVDSTIPDVVVKENGSITIPVTATLNNPSSATEALTVTLTGIPGANVGTFSSPIGTYDAVHHTWTVTLAPGQNLNTSFTFTPYHDSDVDFGSLHLTATATDSVTGTVTSATDFYVTTDAVAQTPIITAHGSEGLENTALAVTLTGAVTDPDGSESVTGYKISGVPDGFTLNHGTYDATTHTWTLSPTDINGLTISSPHNYVGSLSLTATVLNAETTINGKEVDTTDNTNHASTGLTVTWDQIPAPVITGSTATVAEVNLPTNATVNGHVTVNYGTDTGNVAEDNKFSSSVPLTSGGEAVTVTAMAGLSNFVISYNPVTGVYTYPTPGPSHYEGVTASGKEVFELTVNADGTYSFQLDAPLDHPAPNTPNDAITLNFGVTATGHEGGTADGTITINVLDDAPVAHADANYFTLNNGSTTGNVVTGVNESAGGADTLSHDGNNHLTQITFGSHVVDVPTTGTVSIDGASGNLTIAADGSYTYTLHQTTQVVDRVFVGNTFPVVAEQQSLHDTTALGEQHANLVVSGGSQVTISAVSSTAVQVSSIVAYTIAADGTLQGAKIVEANDHTAAAGTQIVYTAGAGATEVGFAEIANGFNLNHGYSGLDLTKGALNFVYDYGQTDQRAANVADSGSHVSLVYTDTSGHATVLAGNEYFTSDRGASDPLSTDNTIHTISGLTTAGDSSSLRIGFEDLPAGKSDFDYNDTIIDVKISGSIITNSATSDQFGYTVTDNDGSTSSSTLTFGTHAVPVIGTTLATVAENDLLNGLVTSHGAINVNLGGEAGTFAANGNYLQSTTLTQDGHAITIAEANNVYTGTANGHEVFNLHINADGTYDFNLEGAIDHVTSGTYANNTLEIDFGYTATNAQGTATGTINIDILGSAPVAHADIVALHAITGSTTGNVISEAVTASADGGNALSQVVYGSHSLAVASSGTTTIDGTHGDLTVSSSGAYTYTLHSGQAAGASDQFSFTVKDADGSASSSTLTFTSGQGETLVGHNGSADTFAIKAFGGVDTIQNFNSAEGDKLDLSKLLTGYNATQSHIDNFIHATSTGGNTTISVNATGDGNAAHFVNVAVLQGVASVNVDELLAHKAIVAAAA